MSDQFKALILNQKGEEFTREVKLVDKSFPKHGDVTIKVDYSDLNFKDGMILKNGGRLVKEFPHIPGCLLYTSPSPRDLSTSRMPSSA